MVSYDDPQSVRLKGEYARQRGLGGAMFHSEPVPTYPCLIVATERAVNGDGYATLLCPGGAHAKISYKHLFSQYEVLSEGG
jgi:hypothetical protein